MPGARGRRIAWAIALGVAAFMVPMAASLGLVALNTQLTPQHAWFPLPALALCLGCAFLAERRWHIGLSHRPGVAWGRIYFLAFTTTVLGICVAILQGAAFDMTRAAETGPEGTSAQFRLAFAFALPLVAAILAEVAFRGVMQGRMHALMRPLAAIALVTAVNTAAHRWGAELQAQWLGYAALLAGCGYVRWLSGSVLPALVAHVGQNFALAWVTWNYGPFALGELSPAALAVVTLAGVAALLITVAAGRGARPPAAAMR